MIGKCGYCNKIHTLESVKTALGEIKLCPNAPRDEIIVGGFEKDVPLFSYPQPKVMCHYDKEKDAVEFKLI